MSDPALPIEVKEMPPTEAQPYRMVHEMAEPFSLSAEAEALLPVQARPYRLVREMAALISSPDAMLTQWNGHTDYQFQNHILNQVDHPGPFAQRRQIYRELNARMEAAVINRYEYAKAEHEVEGLVIEREALTRRRWTWNPLGSQRCVHAIAGIDLELSMRRARMAQLQFEWETKIMREGRAFVDILNRTPAIEDRQAAEADRTMWEQRAAQQATAKGAKR